jgi:hypothetical protein
VAPLPTDEKTPWPPPNWAPVTRAQTLWSAWYSGSPDELSYAYQGLGGNSRASNSFFGTNGEYAVGSHFRAPVSSATATNDRYFWGQPVPAAEKRAKLHVPIAGDIASMSADLLYAKKPRLVAPDGDKITQAWLEARDDDELHATLLEAAEVCAALCGVYLRVVWDKQLSDAPWLDIVHPDAAIPTFRHGKLASVVFWRVLDENGSDVVRHLEQHDLMANTIEHQVYVGDRSTLGRVADDLGNYPQMQGITETLGASPDDPSNVITLPDLPKDADSVTYIPNIRPNRLWRWLPDAAPIGRSDYQGVEPLMDALDETYSSWMRDVRLAKSRLLVPPSYLESRGPGKPAIADIDREVFVPLNMLAGGSDKSLIEANQFKIRFQEHQATADALVQAIVHGAGYSPQTFGENSTGGGTITATEIEDRQRRTILTRGKKTHYWRPGQANAVYSLMAVEQSIFGRRQLTPVRPDVVFPDAVLPSPQELAQTAVALSSAQAASKQTLVQMVHPDWPQDQVDEEVARIRDEEGFEVLGRARLSLTAPQGSTETISQQVGDIESGIQIDPAQASADPGSTGATLAT